MQLETVSSHLHCSKRTSASLVFWTEAQKANTPLENCQRRASQGLYHLQLNRGSAPFQEQRWLPPIFPKLPISQEEFWVILKCLPANLESETHRIFCSIRMSSLWVNKMGIGLHSLLRKPNKLAIWITLLMLIILRHNLILDKVIETGKSLQILVVRRDCQLIRDWSGKSKM